MKQPARLALLMLLIGVGLAMGFYYWHGSWASSHRFQMLSTWGLGRYLGQQFPGSHVLILSNPFTQQPDTAGAIVEQETSRVEGLKLGLQPQIKSVEVAYPSLKTGALTDPYGLVEDPQTTTPLSYLMEPEAFDDLLAAHPETDIIVSLIGLPSAPSTVQAWIKAGNPRFAFLLPDFRFLGNPSAIREAFQRGKLAACILTKPGTVTSPEAVGRLSLKEFDRQFLLVTPDNLDQLLAEWPNLFQPR